MSSKARKRVNRACREGTNAYWHRQPQRPAPDPQTRELIDLLRDDGAAEHTAVASPWPR